jgi:microcystin-dependent protein
MALKNGRTSVAVETVLVGSVHPSGSLIAFAGVNAPDGWLLCHGQELNRSEYSSLFLALETTYGVGNGSTTFNIPDLRGRVAAGKDDMGGVAASRLTAGGAGITGTTLGANGGAQTHTLSTAQLASHTHTQNAHTHTQNAHNHDGYGRGQAGAGGDNQTLVTQAFDAASRNDVTANATPTNQNTTATNQNSGSGSAHQNTQPTIILNYIIKI